jgi:hypothetical protein
LRVIEVEDETYEFIVFAARAAGISEAAVVQRAVAALRAPAPSSRPVADPWSDRSIFATYRGTRVSARFLPATRRVTVLSEPLAGKGFNSPSAAATAVVAALNPDRTMTKVNGLRFWRDAATGARLDAFAEVLPRGAKPDVDVTR